MKIDSLTMTMAVEALYDDYLKCHLFLADPPEHPYNPLKREQFVPRYKHVIVRSMEKMEREGKWEQPFSAFILTFKGTKEELLDAAKRHSGVPEVEGNVAPRKVQVLLN